MIYFLIASKPASTKDLAHQQGPQFKLRETRKGCRSGLRRRIPQDYQRGYPFHMFHYLENSYSGQSAMGTMVHPQRRLLIASRLRPLSSSITARDNTIHDKAARPEVIRCLRSFSRLTTDCKSLCRYETPAHIDHYVEIDWSQAFTDLRDHENRLSTIVGFTHQLTPILS